MSKRLLTPRQLVDPLPPLRYPTGPVAIGGTTDRLSPNGRRASLPKSLKTSRVIGAVVIRAPDYPMNALGGALMGIQRA